MPSAALHEPNLLTPILSLPFFEFFCGHLTLVSVLLCTCGVSEPVSSAADIIVDTMPLLRSTLTVALLAVLAAAETHKITVGSSTFDPGTITAAEGDVLQFYFDSSNHSVVSGSYQYACSPLQLGTGFYSGIVNSTVRHPGTPSSTLSFFIEQVGSFVRLVS